MARTRLLDPRFFTDAALADIEQTSGLPLRLAYAALWCQADREGRFAWKPRELQLGCLPYDNVDFAAVLDALASIGKIARYEVDGRTYGFIPNFLLFQRPHPRESASMIPPMPTQGAPKATPRRAEGKPRRTMNNGLPVVSVSNSDTESDTEPCGAFEEAWLAYPVRPNNPKAKALRAWQARLADGVAPAALLAGVRAYASYVSREHVPPRFVKLAATFFGPDRHWETDYAESAPVLVPTYDANGEMSDEFRRLAYGGSA